MQRWCSHSAYVGGAGADEVMQSDDVEVVQRRCRGGAEVVCRGNSKVMPAEVVVQWWWCWCWCRGGGEEVVQRLLCRAGAGCAEVVVQRWWCRGVVQSGSAEVVQTW